MKLRDVFDPPIPEDYEACRGRTQKRRWCANEALKYLTEARAHVELAELRGDPGGLAMTIASGLVSKAQSALSQFDGELAAGLVLRKWPPLLEIGEPTTDYFRRHYRLLDKAIRRLRINRFSLSESFWAALFGSPEPLSF